MPLVEANNDRALCPAGLHTLTLVEVARKEVDSFDGAGKDQKFVWRFLTDKQDPETGLQYELSVWTGVRYGNSKARLTWLLDLLVPGITPKQAIGLDTDTLLHRRYEASVKHAPSKKDPDKKYAEAIYLRPLPDEADVFADTFEEEGAAKCDGWEVAACTLDGCHTMLTKAEIKACQKREWPAVCAAHAAEYKRRIEADLEEDVFA